jgi:hypothetical protein
MNLVGYQRISAVLADLKADGIEPVSAATVRDWVAANLVRAQRKGAPNAPLEVNAEDVRRMHMPRPANELPDESIRRIRELASTAPEFTDTQTELIRLVLEATPE